MPLALFSEDALAWGLCTHVYFAQLLIWAVPLADPRFRTAVARLPEMMLAGACLPDVALLARAAGAPELTTTHQWSSSQRLLWRANDDETRALAVGYACHLLSDIVAHNHFVPAHQQLWFDRSMLTHAVSEWTMDAHVMSQLFVRPARLMRRHFRLLSCCAAEQFGCEPARARRALRWLSRGERALRASSLPGALLSGARALDRRHEHRLDWYVAETTARLGQINRLIEGEAPVWRAELDCARVPSAGALEGHLPLPQDFF